MLDSDIGLSTHLQHLIFTLYIRTYVLSFVYIIIKFSCSHRDYSFNALFAHSRFFLTFRWWLLALTSKKK